MRRLSFRFALGLLGIALAVAPAWGQNREHQQMMADIRMLQADTAQLNALLGELAQTLQMIRESLDSQGNDLRRGFANQQLQIDSVATGVRVVREKVDENNVRVSSLAQEVEALRMAVPMMGAPLTDLAVDPETGLPLNQDLAPPPGARQPGDLAQAALRHRVHGLHDRPVGALDSGVRGLHQHLPPSPVGG